MIRLVLVRILIAGGDCANVVNVFIDLTDTADLAGGWAVWFTKGARTWLNGRYASANWNVDRLEQMKDEIMNGDKLKVKLVV